MKAEFNLPIDLVKVTEDALNKALAVVLIEKDCRHFVSQLVKQMLGSKVSSYGKDTLLQCALRTAVKEMVKERVGEWVDLHKEEIGQLVDAEMRKLTLPQVVAKNVVELVQGMQMTLKPFAPVDAPETIIDDDEAEEFDEEE